MNKWQNNQVLFQKNQRLQHLSISIWSWAFVSITSSTHPIKFKRQGVFSLYIIEVPFLASATIPAFLSTERCFDMVDRSQPIMVVRSPTVFGVLCNSSIINRRVGWAIALIIFARDSYF